MCSGLHRLGGAHALRTIVPSCDGPSFKQHILKLLKRYERPGRIDLVFQDAGSIVNYK